MADNGRGMDANDSSTVPSCPGCAQRVRRIAQLEARNAQLESRLAEYEKRTCQLAQIIEQLRRGGKRQAAPFSKGPPKLNPKKPGRKSGDDYGAKAFRAVPPVMDETHDVPLPPRCPRCGGETLEHQGTVQQYQTEIPTRVIHRQFNIAVGRCACCGKHVRGRHALQTSDAVGCCGAVADIHDIRGGSKQVILKEIGGDGSYEIPYGILLPRGVEGLLVVGRCVSADQVANSSIRQQAGCLVTAQAGGTAAALAVRWGISPREISTAQLQELLLGQGAIIPSASCC